MALMIEKDDYNFYGEYQMSSLGQIAQAERRLAAKKEALEDMKNECNLIEQQTFNIYKNNVVYTLLDQRSAIKKCQKWLNMLSKNQDLDGNKLDKRKKYEEKDAYEWYTNYVSELLGIETMSDVKFIEYLYGDSTTIQFIYKSHRWGLFVPHINNIRLKTYQSLGSSAFKLSLSHSKLDDACIWNCVGSTYDEEELKNIMASGVEKYCK